jgi:hypothetical protein
VTVYSRAVRGCLVGVGLLLGLLLGGTAMADDAGKRDTARRITAVADEAFAGGDFASAAAGYREAHRHYPTPRLFYNLGLSYDGMGKPAEAVDAYENFLIQATDAPSDARVYATLRVEQLAPKVGRLEIETTTGALVRVDGVERGQAPLGRALPVSPGEHTVTAERNGFTKRSAKIRVAAAATRSLALGLNRISLVSAPVESKPLLKRWWFWGAVGAVVITSTALVLADYLDDGIPDSDGGPTILDIR